MGLCRPLRDQRRRRQHSVRGPACMPDCPPACSVQQVMCLYVSRAPPRRSTPSTFDWGLSLLPDGGIGKLAQAATLNFMLDSCIASARVATRPNIECGGGGGGGRNPIHIDGPIAWCGFRSSEDVPPAPGCRHTPIFGPCTLMRVRLFGREVRPRIVWG